MVGDTENKVLEGHEKTVTPYSYGFGFNYTKVFKDLEEEVFELFSFNPENTSIDERYELSKKIVFEEFDENSYLFDKISNFEEIERVV